MVETSNAKAYRPYVYFIFKRLLSLWQTGEISLAGALAIEMVLQVRLKVGVAEDRSYWIQMKVVGSANAGWSTVASIKFGQCSTNNLNLSNMWSIQNFLLVKMNIIQYRAFKLFWLYSLNRIIFIISEHIFIKPSPHPQDTFQKFLLEWFERTHSMQILFTLRVIIYETCSVSLKIVLNKTVQIFHTPSFESPDITEVAYFSYCSLLDTSLFLWIYDKIIFQQFLSVIEKNIQLQHIYVELRP